MEVNDLYKFVLMLVLVGMILGVGILALDKFRDVAWNTATTVDEALTLTNGTTSTLAHGNVTSLTLLENGTNAAALTGVTYTFTAGAGTIAWTNNVSGSYQNGVSVNATYSWEQHNTPAATALGQTNAEIAKIPSDWLGLIVTITVLAIIFGIVVRSFAARARQ
jgi:hypothetical protein